MDDDEPKWKCVPVELIPFLMEKRRKEVEKKKEQENLHWLELPIQENEPRKG